nr:quinate permease [Quercus suber]
MKGIMLGYFASYGSSIHISNNSQLQWVVPNLLHIYFAAIIFTLSFFAIESPRWLLKVGKHSKAEANLARIRGLHQDHWYVQTELQDVNDQLDREMETRRSATRLGLIRQWSGANSITIYAPQYFAMVGQTGSSEKLFATAIFGIVKFVSAVICALFLVDFIGRKRSLMSGIIIQFFAMLYMALFLVIDTSVADEGAPQSPSQHKAATAAIVAIYLYDDSTVSPL